MAGASSRDRTLSICDWRKGNKKYFVKVYALFQAILYSVCEKSFSYLFLRNFFRVFIWEDQVRERSRREHAHTNQRSCHRSFQILDFLGYQSRFFCHSFYARFLPENTDLDFWPDSSFLQFLHDSYFLEFLSESFSWTFWLILVIQMKPVFTSIWSCPFVTIILLL
jgi:hypothetical protein